MDKVISQIDEGWCPFANAAARDAMIPAVTSMNKAGFVVRDRDTVKLKLSLVTSELCLSSQFCLHHCSLDDTIIPIL